MRIESRINYDDGTRRKNHPTKKYYKKEEPFLCIHCNKVWQYTDNYLYTEYVIDFPRYGCTKKPCKNCKEIPNDE